jgi:uncharacterized protein YukE
MADGSTLQFDYDKARELETKLVKEIENIKIALDKVNKLVESCREWWKGGSEEAFIRNFMTTRKDVEKSLQRWLEDYRKLLKEVAKEKELQEKELKDALKI